MSGLIFDFFHSTVYNWKGLSPIRKFRARRRLKEVVMQIYHYEKELDSPPMLKGIDYYILRNLMDLKQERNDLMLIIFAP